MNNKRFLKTTISLILLAVLIINSSVPSLADNEKDWIVGSEYIFGEREREVQSYINLKADLETNMEYLDEYERKYVIDSISAESTEVTLRYDSGNEYDRTLTTSADLISNNFANYFYHHRYYWDEENNRTVLTSFEADFYSTYYFVNPDWEIFAEDLAILIDRTQVVDTVSSPTTTYEITLGDFFDSCKSYSISGIREDLETPFGTTGASTKWSFVFDLSGVIYDREHDYYTDEDTYYPYSKYLLTTTLDYSNGGILNAFDETLSAEVTVDNIKQSFEWENKIRLGGTSAIETPYNFGYTLFAFLLIPSIIVYLRKKKKNI